tara:strand:+ start:232 stop:501 length:270 start_codon:yes stop_codon:yes gene_type:complete
MAITIDVTEAEQLALDYITADVKGHFTNALQSRAKIASQEIISILFNHCNANEIAIATGEVAQLKQAYELKLIVKASNVGGTPNLPPQE